MGGGANTKQHLGGVVYTESPVRSETRFTGVKFLLHEKSLTLGFLSFLYTYCL